jgi:radical SAM protein with 4Fe4S-binding SPASM domain
MSVSFPEHGIHHAMADGMRLHLKKTGKEGLVWVNGTSLLHLNPTGRTITEAFIHAVSSYNGRPGAASAGEVEKTALETLSKKYPKVKIETLREDYNYVISIYKNIALGSCPVEDMGLEFHEVNPLEWNAPPRMDLALTYDCNTNCAFCYTGGPSKTIGLTTAQWKQVIDKIWDVGVPNITFTGGEPTLYPDLVELVGYAEAFVTGLITNGRRMTVLAEPLKKASLDYVQISIESGNKEVHNRLVGAEAFDETVSGIKASLAAGIETITNTTLTKANYLDFPALIKTLAAMGIKTAACNSLICSGRGTHFRDTAAITDGELKSVLTEAKETAQACGVRLEWYSPTCFNQFNPIEFGFGVKSCSAAQYNLTIEPDGAVIPCQSWLHEKLGNILNDDWEKIWGHPSAVALREHKYINSECTACDKLALCGGGCPLERGMTKTIK